jgi:hypothetical protein
MRDIAFATVMVLLGIPIVALSWLIVRAGRNPAPPMRPELLRRRLDRSRGRSGAERAAAWMMRLGLLLPGALLLAFAHKAEVRVMGGVIVAWSTLPLPLAVWLRRSGRLDAAQRRALDASEDFWSQPDAERRARDMRRARFGRVAG